MEKAPIIINTQYGGFSYSQKAIDEYNIRKLKDSPADFIPIKGPPYGYCNLTVISRTDKIMVEIVNDLGEEASGYCACLKVQYVVKLLLDYVDIYEYDGHEYINGYYLDKYKVDKMKEIIKSNINDLEKLTQIKEIIEFELDDEAYKFI